MTFSSVFLGVATALMVKVFSLCSRSLFFGTPVSFVVLIFVTLTVTITFFTSGFYCDLCSADFLSCDNTLGIYCCDLTVGGTVCNLILACNRLQNRFQSYFFLPLHYTDCGLQVCDRLCSDSDCNQYIGLHATIQYDRHPC